MDFFLFAALCRFLFVFTLAFAVGSTCVFTGGKVILESVIRTIVVVVSLTFYTVWAAKRGYDFNFLHPLLIAVILVLIFFTLIQILFPMCRTRISMTIYACLASIFFCNSIVYDTDYLIKQHSCDDNIWAVVSMCSNIIGLFISSLLI